MYLKDELGSGQIQHGVLHSRQDASFNIQGPFGFVNRRAKVFDLPVLEREHERLLFQSSGKLSRAGGDRSFCSI